VAKHLTEEMHSSAMHYSKLWYLTLYNYLLGLVATVHIHLVTW